jgi:hypothetical protein
MIDKIATEASAEPEPRDKEKIFCIGCNKTGTTSLERALKELGYSMGNQAQGEWLAKNYLNADFESIQEFCLSADAFQDVPFSLPGTYVHLDRVFTRAKFILTVRDSADQWYESLIRAHSNFVAAGNLPTTEDLKACEYRYPGYMWDVQCRVIAADENEPYDKEALVRFYNTHNESVRNHFKNTDKLLEINVSQPGAYQRMCQFLGINSPNEDFPWLNRTS